jgi:hypothetical protein
VAVTATDRVGVTEVAMMVDGSPAGVIPFRGDLGRYAFLWDARRVLPGPHTIEITARDAADNEATASVVVELPAVPPASPVVGTPTG